MSATFPRDPASPLGDCQYCGLPVRAARGVEHAERYCCLGCELAANISADNADADVMVGRTAMRLGLAVFFSMNVMVFTMVLWSWDAYSISFAENAAVFKDLLRLACLVFATPVVLLLGRPLIASVLSQIRRRIISADVLLVVGVGAAYIYSIVSIVAGTEHIYFEVACMILLAVTLGRWLEAEGKQRAMKSLESLQNLLPNSARLVVNGQTQQKALDQVKSGQWIRVLPGERIPLDGVVEAGSSFVDQRLVTGESNAFRVATGDSVFGGTANLDGSLEIRVTAPASQGVIQRLIEAVHETVRQSSRPERLADQLAAVFAPLICVIAVAVFVAQYQAHGSHAAMMASMSVALIACPCALAIATPLAIWAALSKAAQHGIVFRSSDDLTSLAEIDHICLDKTGTLTTGTPRLIDSFQAGNDHRFEARIAKLLAAQTRHPLAAALLAQIPDDNADFTEVSVTAARTLPGKGVIAELEMENEDGSRLQTTAILGSKACCEEYKLQFPHAIQEWLDQLSTRNTSSVFVGWDGMVQACFIFDESLRRETRPTIELLQDMSLSITLLTGDQSGRASRVADELGVSVASQLLPADKQAAITDLQSQGRLVAMVGDGLNDAPALGLANVGIALGCGVEVSRDAADVCLMSSNLLLLPWAIGLARRTRSTIRRNLFWRWLTIPSVLDSPRPED